MARFSILCLALALASPPAATAGQHASRGTAPRQQRVFSLLRDINMRLDRPNAARRDVIADSERLRTAVSSLGAYDSGRDDGSGEQVAREAFAWLARATDRFHWDPLVSPALMRTYQFFGDFYQRYPPSYTPWLRTGYSGANRLARALVLSSNGREYEGALESLALDMAMLGYLVQGDTPDVLHGSGASDTTQVPDAANRPIAVPSIDGTSLTAEQQAAWEDLRTRFRDVSIRVHQANIALDDLTARLRSRNLTLNSGDAVTALKMQGFLEDAADLARARLFDKATEALRRADYERGKLRNVTGP